MSNLMWKIRKLFSKIMPLALVAGLVYGGWTLHKKGTFRNGIGPGVSAVLSKIPYFGTRFRHHLWSQKSTAYSEVKKSSRSSRRRHSARHSTRRHHRRR